MAHNSFLFFSEGWGGGELLELGAIFQVWNCTVLNDCAIFVGQLSTLPFNVL